MKKLIGLALLVGAAAPALACTPPPGLSPQQWYSLCRRDMEDGFARGFGGRQSHDAFMTSMYQMYRSARPTYNPVIEQQQRQLADTMASRHQQNMDAMNQQQAQRNRAFAAQQRDKAWQQNEEMNYINNEHCAVWNTAHTYCLKVPN